MFCVALSLFLSDLKLHHFLNLWPKQVTENAALVQYVRARCGDTWQTGTSNLGNTTVDLTDEQAMMDEGAVKLYYSQPSASMTTRHYPLDTAGGPWASSHPWEQEGPMLESQLMGGSIVPERNVSCDIEIKLASSGHY